MNKQEALNKIEELKNFIKDYKEEKTYKEGDIFIVKHGTTIFILSQVKANEFCLITLSNGGRGNRYTDPVLCKSQAITKEEINEMCGDTMCFDDLKLINEEYTGLVDKLGN
jgi:hypothetical protein